MLPRLLSGTLAAVFLPLGLTFTVLIPPMMQLVEGGGIEIVYDPQEPSDFEPVATVERRLSAA